VVAFPNPSASMPSFTPIVPGTYAFQLIVSDGLLDAAPVFLAVQVVPLAALVPDAAASIDPADDGDADGRVSTATSPIGLLGGASSGTGLTFAWTQTRGPAVDLAGETTSSASFSPPVAGVYAFLLIVRDSNGVSDAATVSVIVDSATNAAPISNAGADAAAGAGEVVTLDGSGSSDSGTDADGVTTFGTGLLAFWRQVSGPAVLLSSPSGASPTFTPLKAGTYAFELVVSDGAAESAGDVVAVTVTGTIVAGSGGGSSGGGCGLTGFEVLLLLALRRRRYIGCDAAR